MALIKYATKEITAKIVYYGPGLSGKTTNLQFINQKKPGGKCGELLSLATEGDRTLFFDLLPMNVGMIAGFRLRFQLFTVPGQIFYNKTRKMVLRDADGVVFVGDSQEAMVDRNTESLENLKDNLRENGLDYDTIPFVLQFNKRDLPSVMSLEQMNRDLNDKNAMFFEAVATTGVGILETLQHIMKLVLFDLDKKYNIYKPRVKESDESRRPAPQAPSAGAARPVAPPPRPASHPPAAEPAPSRGGASFPAPPIAPVRPAPVAGPPPSSTPHPVPPRPLRPPRPGTSGHSGDGTWDLTASVRAAVEEEEVVRQPVRTAGDDERVRPAPAPEPAREPVSAEIPIVAKAVDHASTEGDEVDEEEIEVATEEEVQGKGGEETLQDLTDAVPVEEAIEEPEGDGFQPIPESAEPVVGPEPAPLAEEAEPVPEPPAPAPEPGEAESRETAPPPSEAVHEEPQTPAPRVTALEIPAADGARLSRLEEAYREITTKVEEFMMEFRDAFVEGKISRDKDKRDILQAIYELRQTPDMMTAKEVSKYLNVSISSIYQLANEGKIPCTRLEGRRKWIFPKALVDEWIIRQAKEG